MRAMKTEWGVICSELMLPGRFYLAEERPGRTAEEHAREALRSCRNLGHKVRLVKRTIPATEWVDVDD